MTAAPEKPKPYAGCPVCHKPLVTCLAVKYKEWYCATCDKHYEYLQARAVEWSPEMETYYENAREEHNAIRRAGDHV